MELNPNNYPMRTRINIQSFIRKYMPVLPMDLFTELNNLSMQGTHAQITTSTIIELDKRLAERKAADRALNACAKRNTKGKEYEKAGKIGLAIRTYEKNIEGDCYPACHSFDRLMVLYRKRKEYDKELAVIEKALDVLCKRYPDLENKYEDRKRKVLDLIEKQNK